MATQDENARAARATELGAAVQNFTQKLQLASANYRASEPEQARYAMWIALFGTIEFISVLHPDPSYALPLQQLLVDLADLDHGTVAPRLKPIKVFSRPPVSLSEGLFRAIVAAAMTVLMDRRDFKLDDAARDVKRRLSKIGARHPSGERIGHSQIKKWRETMMTERAAENRNVASYQIALTNQSLI
jgi:hypothetical protein